MNLSELDFENLGSWPLGARLVAVLIVFAVVSNCCLSHSFVLFSLFLHSFVVSVSYCICGIYWICGICCCVQFLLFLHSFVVSLSYSIFHCVELLFITLFCCFSHCLSLIVFVVLHFCCSVSVGVCCLCCCSCFFFVFFSLYLWLCQIVVYHTLLLFLTHSLLFYLLL